MEKSTKQQSRGHPFKQSALPSNIKEEQCQNEEPKMMEVTAGSGSDNEDRAEGAELSILKKALEEFILDDHIFILHREPKKGRIVLTET